MSLEKRRCSVRGSAAWVDMPNTNSLAAPDFCRFFSFITRKSGTGSTRCERLDLGEPSISSVLRPCSFCLCATRWAVRRTVTVFFSQSKSVHFNAHSSPNLIPVYRLRSTGKSPRASAAERTFSCSEWLNTRCSICSPCRILIFRQGFFFITPSSNADCMAVESSRNTPLTVLTDSPAARMFSVSSYAKAGVRCVKYKPPSAGRMCLFICVRYV